MAIVRYICLEELRIIKKNPGQPVSRLIFKPRLSRRQSRSANHYVAFISTKLIAEEVDKELLNKPRINQDRTCSCNN
jgi:hypothetical protein